MTAKAKRAAMGKPTREVKATHTAVLVTKAINTQRLTAANAHGGAYMAAKRLESERIAADIAAFEANGGKVQKLDAHETSRPLNGDYRDTFTINSSNRGQFKSATQRRALPVHAADEIDDDSDE
jgi:hypothetical protein